MDNKVIKWITWSIPTLFCFIAILFLVRSCNDPAKEQARVSSSRPSNGGELLITKVEPLESELIPIPFFHKLECGISESDVGYIIHVRLKYDKIIKKVPIPARNSRPPGWVNPLGDDEYSGFGFSVDPASPKEVGHITYTITR